MHGQEAYRPMALFHAYAGVLAYYLCQDIARSSAAMREDAGAQRVKRMMAYLWRAHELGSRETIVGVLLAEVRGHARRARGVVC